MKTILNHLSGGIDTPTYIALLLFALFGAVLTSLYRLNQRDKHSKVTPTNFCWKFYIRDNYLDFIQGFLFTILGLRFSNELLGIETTMWIAVLIGAFNQQIAAIFMKNKLTGRK